MTSDVAWPRPAGPLMLRPPTSDDLDQVLAWRNRPEVTRWLLRTTVEPDAFRTAWLDSVEDPDQHTAVAVLDGVVVGTGSLDVRDGMGQFQGDAWRGAKGCSAISSIPPTPATATRPRSRAPCSTSPSASSAFTG